MSNAAQNTNDHREASNVDDLNLMQFPGGQASKRSEQWALVAGLPENVKRRVRALRKLQLDTTKLEAEFHLKVHELERTLDAKHKEVFKRRNKIINGEYEPTDEECDFPDFQLPPGIIQAMSDMSINGEEVPVDDENCDGIPNFWLTILKNVASFVKEQDEPALKHLVDIRSISKTGEELSFLLEFHFSLNEYFTNSVLTKEYFLKCEPDPDDPFSFDGPEIYRCVGCTINWKEGKDLTVKTVKKKSHLNVDRSASKTMKIESFFNFFDPPTVPEDENDPMFEDINTILETDFEVGHYLKDRVIPRAVLFYTGETDDFSDNSSEENDGSDDCYATDEDAPGGGVDGEGDVITA